MRREHPGEARDSHALASEIFSPGGRMNAREIMTPDPKSCRASDSIQEAARLMRDCDCGSVPVVDEEHRLVGVITDRDLAIRAIAEGKPVDTPVSELMTADPFYSTED